MCLAKSCPSTSVSSSPPAVDRPLLLTRRPGPASLFVGARTPMPGRQTFNVSLFFCFVLAMRVVSLFKGKSLLTVPYSTSCDLFSAFRTFFFLFFFAVLGFCVALSPLRRPLRILFFGYHSLSHPSLLSHASIFSAISLFFFLLVFAVDRHAVRGTFVFERDGLLQPLSSRRLPISLVTPDLLSYAHHCRLPLCVFVICAPWHYWVL